MKTSFVFFVESKIAMIGYLLFVLSVYVNANKRNIIQLGFLLEKFQETINDILKSIKKLFLSGNQLTSIDREVFSGLIFVTIE